MLKFSGKLAEEFGAEWHIGDSENLKEAFKLVECQTPSFKATLISAMEAGLDMAVLVGDKLIENPEEVWLTHIQNNDIHIALVPAGSKGLGKILAAIFIAVFAFYLPGIVGAISGSSAFVAGGTLTSAGVFVQNTLYALAVNLAMGGVTELLVKTPKTIGSEDDTSLFNGPDNAIKAGQPVPILYGQLLVGGTPLSVSYRAMEFDRSYGGITGGQWDTTDGSDNGKGGGGSVNYQTYND